MKIGFKKIEAAAPKMRKKIERKRSELTHHKFLFNKKRNCSFGFWLKKLSKKLARCPTVKKKKIGNKIQNSITKFRVQFHTIPDPFNPFR